MNCDLSGTGVLVTRPSGQAQPLCDLIAENGGTPIPFPTIAIGGPRDQIEANERLGRLAEHDLIIFVSPNAVRYAFRLLGDRPLPRDARIAVVGKGTARALCEFDVYADLLPEGSFDSESLLAMPQLQHMADRSVLIVRGNGGRPLLGDTLMMRGARVEYAEVYTRGPVDVDSTPLLDSWPGQVHVVTATSCEILENLFAMLGERGKKLLNATTVVVVSERIAERARELGCSDVVLASEASDLGIVTAICDHLKK